MPCGTINDALPKKMGIDRGSQVLGRVHQILVEVNMSDKLYGELEIENNKLERFENRTPVRRYEVSFECPEFTCICPRSGFPDFATIRIRYVPDQFCVELKSLKLYINGFRNDKVFHEDVTNRIMDDLIELLDPHEIEVVGDFNVRGNIKTVVRAHHEKKASK
tara:strand:+ start:1004 stop:1492 length:489 start_codon:yes stop_codon:yes gene_type:complete